ncbi:hypothetical protein C0993_006794 [Termitomyces sp. T159_Od127]|nr:hypothetical protein C0993_006794 [Termitomyces sp. T159_Od127]
MGLPLTPDPDMSQNTALFLLPAEEKFNGSNWTTFRITLTEAACRHGLLGYLDGTIKNPVRNREEVKPAPTTATTWWGAANPADEWPQHDAYGRSMIILNIMNSVSARVKMDSTAAEAWSSITLLNDAKSDLGLIHTKEELTSIKYTNGSSIKAHFQVLRTVWTKANDQGADITNRKFRAYII